MAGLVRFICYNHQNRAAAKHGPPPDPAVVNRPQHVQEIFNQPKYYNSSAVQSAGIHASFNQQQFYNTAFNQPLDSISSFVAQQQLSTPGQFNNGDIEHQFDPSEGINGLHDVPDVPRPQTLVWDVEAPAPNTARLE